MLTNTKGIVIKNIDYDDERVIFLLDEIGETHTFRAKKLHRKNATNFANVEPFCYGEYELYQYTENGYKVLKHSNYILSNRFLFEGVYLVNLIFRLIGEAVYNYASTNEQNHKELFDILFNTLSAINSSSKTELLNISIIALRDILHYFGILNISCTCGCCGNASKLISFNLLKGGFICSSCFNQDLDKKFDTKDLKEYYYLMKIPLEKHSNYHFEKKTIISFLSSAYEIMQSNSLVITRLAYQDFIL